MKSVDKFGNKIYEKTWRIIRNQGEQLFMEGWKESRRNPNLFYKSFESYRVFADMRGSDVIPIWDDPRPLLYIRGYAMDTSHFAVKYPELYNTNCKDEFVLLRHVPPKIRDSIIGDFRRMGMKFRLSFYEEAEPDEFGKFEIHTCLNCDSLLKTSELKWCSEQCKNEGLAELKSCALSYCQDLPVCVLCNKKIPIQSVHVHHITYFPEKTIPLHASCHLRLHKGGSHSELLPPDGDSEKFYKRK